MKVYHDIPTEAPFRNSILTIGSFDGLHTGHREILRKVRTLAALYDAPSVVITFHPHPRSVVYPKDKSLRLLTTLQEKIALFRETGIEHLVIVPFTIEFSQLLPQDYIENFLIRHFNPRVIVIGYDHKFGLNRRGNIHMLKSYGDQFGFELVEIEKQTLYHIGVSSSKIRQAIQSGQIEMANRLLGAPFLMTGKVVHGQKIGNTLGFPTANLALPSPLKVLPPEGIYAVFVQYGKERYRGMMYIGRRPTIHQTDRRSIEVHIFNFSAYIYGEDLMVEMIRFVRADEKLDSLQALTTKLREDQEKVGEILADYEKSQIPKLSTPLSSF